MIGQPQVEPIKKTVKMKTRGRSRWREDQNAARHRKLKRDVRKSKGTMSGRSHRKMDW